MQTALKSILYAAGALALAAVAVLAGVLAYEAHWARLEAFSELRIARAAGLEQLDRARADLARTQADLVRITETRAASIEQTADRRLEAVQRDVAGQLLVLNATASFHLGRANDSVAELARLRSDLRPVLASADELLAQTSGTVAVLRPQALGLIAATKVTAGETAQAARRIDAALPQFLVTWDRIGKNSDRTTDATARTMDNLARATKPLPTWARVGLAVAPPVVSVGASVITTLAIRGK